MVDKEYVRRYMTELETMVTTLHTYDEQMTKLKATIAMSVGSAILEEQMKEMKQNQESLVKVYALALERSQEFTNCNTLEIMSNLLNDMQINMNQASEMYQLWRKAKAKFELIVAMADFENNEERAGYEKELAYLHQRSDAALELVQNLIPAGPRLIHV